MDFSIYDFLTDIGFVIFRKIFLTFDTFSSIPTCLHLLRFLVLLITALVVLFPKRCLIHMMYVLTSFASVRCWSCVQCIKPLLSTFCLNSWSVPV